MKRRFKVGKFLWSKKRIEDKISLKSGLNETDANGYSALMYACMHIQTEDQNDYVKRIIHAGGDVDMVCEIDEEYIPLLYACKIGNMGMAKLLLQNGANPNVQGEWNKTTPLIYAATRATSELLQCLLEKNADTELKDDYGQTALMCAVSLWSIENAVHLVEAGADINAQDEVGRTPLIHAMNNGFQDTVDYFLRFKIDMEYLMMHEQFDYYFKYFPSIREYIRRNLHSINTENIKNWNAYRLKILFD